MCAPPVVFETTISRLEVGRLIHWATGAINSYRGSNPKSPVPKTGRLIHWAIGAKRLQ